MDPQELLNQVNAKLKDRIVIHRQIWRWIWNRCPECGNKMLVHEDYYRKIRTCSVYPGHKPYATGVNTVFGLWVIIFILMTIILVGNCGKSHIDERRPQSVPKDTRLIPYIRER